MLGAENHPSMNDLNCARQNPLHANPQDLELTFLIMIAPGEDTISLITTEA